MKNHPLPFYFILSITIFSFSCQKDEIDPIEALLGTYIGTMNYHYECECTFGYIETDSIYQDTFTITKVGDNQISIEPYLLYYDAVFEYSIDNQYHISGNNQGDSYNATLETTTSKLSISAGDWAGVSGVEYNLVRYQFEGFKQ